MGPGERLAAQKQQILRVWAERARERLPAAKAHDPLALIDELPPFVDHLVEVLQSPLPSARLAVEEEELAARHGRDRAMKPEWTVRQIVTEYELLREVICEALEVETPLTKDERNRIQGPIAAAVRAAVDEFDRLRGDEHRQLLTLSQLRFDHFVEAVTDFAIFTIDPHGIVSTWNVGAERMKGYTPQEAIGHHFEMLYPLEGRRRDEPMAHLRSASIEGRFRGEGVRLRKNGEEFLADVSITPILQDGKLRGFTKVVQDLTERNHLMQERDLSRTEVDRLRLAAQSRERFVQTLSHDLRSPLSAAKAAAMMISRAPADEAKVRTLAHRISEAIDRSDAMITDLLDAARIDAREAIVLEREPCDLRQIVEDACDELRTHHGDRFRVQAEGSTAGRFDVKAMRRAFDNLLSNALKYGTNGMPVEVVLRRIDDRLLVSVHNQGTVIPLDEQADLFKPFHRARDARNTQQPGWGLGLTVVRGIVEAHGGIIKVESYAKEGTTFTLDLPVEKPRALG